MRIGIDISPMINQQAGVGRYTKELVTQLVRTDQENHYVLFYYYSGKDPKPFARFPNVDLKSKRIAGRVMRLQFFALNKLHMNADFLVGEVDIFHSPDCLLPPFSFKSIMTIYDLAFLLFPQCYTWINRKHLQYTVPMSVAKAVKIIVPSEHTKKDVVKFFKVPAGKIKVIPGSVSERFKAASETEISAFKQLKGLPDKYILFVGTLEPRKNVSTLVEAFSHLHQSMEQDIHLVIAGKHGWLYQETLEKIKRLKMGNFVHLAGHVPDDDLPLLYSGAELFVYPSFYEGFGLPPLEAMACGTPVIVSDTSSLPEIVGDAGILVNPNDKLGLAEKIMSALQDGGVRQEMIKKGLERVKHFSWKETAGQTLKLYQEIAEE